RIFNLADEEIDEEDQSRYVVNGSLTRTPSRSPSSQSIRDRTVSALNTVLPLFPTIESRLFTEPVAPGHGGTTVAQQYWPWLVPCLVFSLFSFIVSFFNPRNRLHVLVGCVYVMFHYLVIIVVWFALAHAVWDLSDFFLSTEKM
ncbi:hypothetical protein PENTCL1PPCAC_7806, partial [Pristionchus entomophagus]